MLSLFRKNKEVELCAICDGEVISIDTVPDKVFSARLLGDGVGFIFEGNTIYAPCDGEVIMVANTSHAVAIRAKNGAEILIHVGLDTVNLNGKGLKPKVAVGDKVLCGNPLIEIDKGFMIEQTIDLTTPMILTNLDQYNIKIEKNNDTVSKGEIVILTEKK